MADLLNAIICLVVIGVILIVSYYLYVYLYDIRPGNKFYVQDKVYIVVYVDKYIYYKEINTNHIRMASKCVFLSKMEEIWEIESNQGK